MLCFVYSHVINSHPTAGLHLSALLFACHRIQRGWNISCQ